MFTEDFSFPKATSNTIPHFTIPPSLVDPDYNLDEDNGRGEGFSRKRFSCSESPDQTSEEKMDMLWEDFNEELQRVSSMNNKKEAQRFSEGGATKEIRQAFCRLQALKMPKTSKTVPLRKIMLKKLFLLRMCNSTHIK
jgi:hypothetical protein